uniref:Uncharacterized protein n=1 Tax=Sander lucioperca TaxID=283035 RepID=A0A8D0AGB2_SANLU
AAAPQKHQKVSCLVSRLLSGGTGASFGYVPGKAVTLSYFKLFIEFPLTLIEYTVNTQLNSLCKTLLAKLTLAWLSTGSVEQIVQCRKSSYNRACANILRMCRTDRAGRTDRVPTKGKNGKNLGQQPPCCCLVILISKHYL